MADKMTDITDIYGDLAAKVWDRMVELVGVHTVMVLVQRAVWVTQQKYSDAEFIQFDENGISFNMLKEKIHSDDIKEIVEEFFGSLISILTRLVGEDIAKKLAQEISSQVEEVV